MAKALSEQHISNTYEKHLKWSKANGYDDSEHPKSIKAHEKAKGITRAEANGIADLSGHGEGWRSNLSSQQFGKGK